MDFGEMILIKRVLKKIIQKSRLEEYKNILIYAIDKGYLLTSLSDWYENNFYTNKKVFLLRHDVDADPVGSFKIYQIEIIYNPDF